MTVRVTVGRSWARNERAARDARAGHPAPREAGRAHPIVAVVSWAAVARDRRGVYCGSGGRTLILARRILIALAGLALSCCARPAGTAHRWPDAAVTYYINTEANTLSEKVIRQVFQTWDRQTHFEFTYGGRNRAGLRRDGKCTVSFLSRWPRSLPISKVAYCRTWYDGRGNIVEADIALNSQIARFTTIETRKPDSYYLEGVLSHEIGHFIGLEHDESGDSLMKPFSPLEESYNGGIIDVVTLQAYSALYGLGAQGP